MINAPEVVRRRVARLYQQISANVVLIGAFLGLVGCLVHFTVNSTFAREIFDATVNKLFSGRIGWTRVTWGPLPWQVRVLEPVIVDPRGVPVIQAREVHASLDLLAILDGELKFDGIVVRGAEVHIVQRPFDDPEHRRTHIFTLEEVFRPPVWLPDDGLPGHPPHLSFAADSIEDTTYVQDIPGARIRVEGANIRNALFELDTTRKIPMTMAAEHVDARRVLLAVGDEAAPLRWEVASFEADGYRWPATGLGDLGLEVNRAQFEVRGDDFRLERFRLGLATAGLPFIQAHLDAHLADAAPHLEQFGAGFVSGPVALHLDGQGEIDSFEGTVVAEGPSLDVRDWHAEDWHAQAAVHGDAFELRELDVRAYEGRVQADGAFDLAAGRGHAHVRLAGVRPERLPLALPPAARPFLAGALTGSVGVHLVDLFTGPSIAADATLVQERDGPGPFGLPSRTALEASATFTASQSRTLRIHSLDVRPGADRVTATGGLDLTAGTLDVAGHAEVADIAAYLRSFGVDVAGGVQARFHATGALASPSIEADVASDAVRYAEFPTSAVEAHARLARGRLTLDPATVTGAGGSATARGTLDLTRSGTPLDLTIGARGVDLATLPLPADISGVVNAEVRVRGPAARPRVEGRVTVDQPRWTHLQLARLEAAGSYAGDAVRVDDFRLADDQGERVSVSGELALAERRYRAAVKITDLPLDLVNRLIPKPIPVRGAVSASIDGEGTFADPHGHGTVKLTGAGYDVYDGGDAELEVSADGHALTAKGRLFGAADLDAVVPTTREGQPARATLRFGGLDLDKRLPQLAKAGLKVHLSGLVEATADLFDKTLDQIRVDLSEVRVGNDQITLRNDGPLQVSYRHGVVNLDRLQVVAHGQRLAASGTMGLAGDVDLRLVGDLDLAILEPFLSDTFTSVDGTASLELDVQGNVLGEYVDITPNGRLRLTSARLTPRSSVLGSELVLTEPADLLIAPPEYEGYGPAMKPGTFEVRLAPTRTLDGSGAALPNRLIVRRDDGEVRVTALTLSFDDFRPSQLYTAFDATGARLTLPGTLRATVDARDLAVSLTGLRDMNRAQINVSGDVNIDEGEYLADLFSSSELTGSVTRNLGSVTSLQQVSVFERVPLLQHLYLQLDIHGDNDIFVRNHVAVFDVNLEIRPNLRLKGFLHPTQDTRDEDYLTLEGTVETLPDTSKIVYAARDFDVQNGLVEFGHGNYLEGHVVAGHTFQIGQGTASSSQFGASSAGTTVDAEVLLDVSIRMPSRNNKPELQIELRSSSGSYSQYELATLVATGRLPDQVSAGASAQPALELALNPVLGLMERQLGNTLNLDRVQLTPDPTGSLTIDLEKDLSRRLRLYSYTPVGQTDTTQGGRKFGLSYRLNNYLSGDLNNQLNGVVQSTTGQLTLHLSLDP